MYRLKKYELFSFIKDCLTFMCFWRYGMKCINSNIFCIPTIYGIRLIFNFPAAVPLLSAYYPSDPTFLPIVYNFPRCTSLVSGSILNCSRAGSPPLATVSLGLPLSNSIATPYSFLVGVRCDSKMQLSDDLTSKMLITLKKK